jgi:hypothetical protein
MGEFARIDGHTRKVGTCDNMYYLRLEDAARATPEPGSISPTLDGMKYRLPFPDEDEVPAGNYQPWNRGQRLFQTIPTPDGLPDRREWWSDPSAADDFGTVQTRHPCGLLVNVACYHGERLPEPAGGFQAFWNGKEPSFYELTAVKRLVGEVFGVVTCTACRKAWRYPLRDLLCWVPDTELRRRLAAYLGEGDSTPGG